MARVKKNTTRQLFEEGGGYGGYEIPTLNRWEERKSPGEEVIRGGVSGGLRGLLGVVPDKTEEQTLLEKLLGGSDPYGSTQIQSGVQSGIPGALGVRERDDEDDELAHIKYRPGDDAKIPPNDETTIQFPEYENDLFVQLIPSDENTRPIPGGENDNKLAHIKYSLGGGSSMNNGSSGYAESVFDRVTDRYRPGGKAQILPRDEVESLIPKVEEDESTQIQSGVRPGLVGASAIDPADRPPVTDDTDRILAQLIGGSDPYGSKQSVHSIHPQVPESVSDQPAADLLEKLIGGPDPYGAKPAGFVKPQVPETEGGSTVPEEVIRGGVSGGLLGVVPDKAEEQTLLEKLLGGSDPYGSKQSVHSIHPQVPETERDTTVPEKESEEQIGTGVTDVGVTDVEVNGYIETLRGILDPDYAARASEDVMGQYAAMTGGRPSSAAISAGTAARADAEATLLRELLSGGDTQSGESGGLLSGLLGENATTGEMDVPEEYAGYADLPGYDTIVPMLESFESEEDMGDYLADMVNKGLISEAVATEYLKRFDDPYEEYDAGGRIDYASMVKNPGGWTLTDDGGTNFFGGLNRNMRIKSPNGQEFTVAQLYRLLKKNGMDAKEAETYLVKLQNYLKSKK